MNHSIGIIGGVDGPTAIAVSGNFAPLIIGLIVVMTAVIAIAVLIKRKRK